MDNRHTTSLKRFGQLGEAGTADDKQREMNLFLMLKKQKVKTRKSFLAISSK